MKSSLKTQTRKVREAVAAGDMAKAEAEFRLTAKKFDRAAAHGVIHRNAAARIKSRLSSRLKSAKQGASPAVA